MKKTYTDIELLNALHTNRDGAFPHLYDLYSTRLHQFAFHLVKHKQDAEDVVSETFFQFNRISITNFPNLANIKAFLFITTRNKCFDLLKSRKRKTLQKDLLSHEALQQVNTKLDDIIIAEDVETVMKAIEELPQECQKICRHVYIDELSTAEIASALDLSPQTVRNQKKIAQIKLRQALHHLRNGK